MLLLIDIGNTNIVFYLYDTINMKKIIKYRVNTYSYKNITIILYYIQNSYISKINDIIISSVVPKIHSYLLPNIKFFFKNSIINFFCYKKVKFLIKTLYSKNVGNDRIANCLGALTKFPNKNILIIDIGTIMTFDIVTSEKKHIGGVIFPGINTILNTIYYNANQIKKSNFFYKNNNVNTLFSCIQKTTKTNISNGIYNGYIGAMKEIIKNIIFEFKNDLFIIGTGGNAFLFKNDNIFNIIDNNLLFIGLLEFYKKCIQ